MALRLAWPKGYNIEETEGEQRATAEVRYVTRTQLSNMSLSVVETDRMKQKTGVGRLLGFLAKGWQTPLPCPALFDCWLLAALLLCTWDPSVKEWTQEAYMSKLWLWAELSCTQMADK